MAEKETTEETTGGRYLTKDYLVRNLQTFWGKIKAYIEQQSQLLTNFIGGQIDLKADQIDLDSLESLVNEKANNSALENLQQTVAGKVDNSAFQEALLNKVDKDGNKVLSTYDFTKTYKDKLDSLKNVTESEDGLMSAQDKRDLDNLVTNAVTRIDDDLNPNSEYPVQNSVITQALENKVDKENPLDSSDIPDEILSCAGNSDGDIILTLHENTKHLKIHTGSEVIEKVYLEFKDGDTDRVFNSFSKTSRTVTVPNPDGKGILTKNKLYMIYIECLELVDTGKYEPFILKIKRDSEDPQEIIKSILKIS